MECWNQPKECMDREAIEQLQTERLQATLNRVYKNVRHYRRTFTEMDFFPEDLSRLSDFQKLPFTTRGVLMQNYPYGMFAVPLREVVRLHAPALTLDNPLVMGFTRTDLKNWEELMARNLTAVGVDKDDVVQIALNFGLMTGPFGVQLGAEGIGASVVPMSDGKNEAQLKIIRDFKTTVLVAAPGFALSLARTAEETGLDPRELSLKYGLFGGEPWPESLREALESRLHIQAFDTYGLSEVLGPGVAWECPQRNGLHIPEDHFLPEIVDPETDAPLPEGEPGELVITTLSKEAYPLIRFRTGALTAIHYAPCECGRSHCRIDRILRRCDDVLMMGGTSIVPAHVEKILAAEIQGPLPHYQLLARREADRDQLSLLIEMSESFFFDEMKKQGRIVEALHRRLLDFLGWEVNVKLVETNAFDTGQKVRDLRNA